MEYDRLGKSEPAGSSSSHAPPTTAAAATAPKQKSKLKLVLILTAAIMAVLAASAAIATAVVRARTGGGGGSLRDRRPSQAMSRACGRTRFPELCVDSMIDFPGAIGATGEELVHISVNVTLARVGRALYLASEMANVEMDPHVRSAYLDCLELLDDSVDLLTRSLTSAAPGGEQAGSTHDVLTWLSAALTNQDTCSEGFDELKNNDNNSNNNNYDVKSQMFERLNNLSELVTNSLAMYSASAAVAGDGDFADIPINNRRRRRLLNDGDEGSDFPMWLSRRERVLLDMPASAINADVIVSKDGSNGTYRTIAEAIKKAPEHSKRRFIVYVRAGRYEENNLKVGMKKTNIMFIGDGKGKTVITGGKSVQDRLTTFRTASFAATGAGFIARDITFENWAGPSKHQAVALRIGADQSVIYRCSIIGYQDTLYTHSKRQFYRDCDIYGTVDFIFGNAAVVLQNCKIHVRKPMQLQKNTITAQSRKDPDQITGISIHACRIVAEPDLEAVKDTFPTYLGRPWKTYSRTVYMLSYLGDHIDPKGWLEWNGKFALDTLYYGEYMNYGPGARLGQRVKWPGYRVITSKEEASRFTVARFILGSSWLPSTGVAYLAGLST